jgi:ribosomal protein S18 acetylase RimI-like enzyme
MSSIISVQAAVEVLAREPLRNVVLLKQLLAHPLHVAVRRVAGAEGAATLVVLDVAASSYDREAYPGAASAVFIESDHPALTEALLVGLPRDAGIVFKLSRESDLAPVAARFRVERRTAFVSYTTARRFAADLAVRTTVAPGDVTFRLFEAQGHGRSWLEPLLTAGKAFACVLGDGDHVQAACFAFENYGPVWEVGGVVTDPALRRRGLGRRVVGTALAALRRRELVPRYQVEEGNEASIRLAGALGLDAFLTIVHHASRC